MPEVGDFVKTTLEIEIRNVRVANALWWRVDSLGDDPGNVVSLTALYTAFWAAVDNLIAQVAVLSCASYENLDGSEGKVVLFPNLPGAIINTAHPQKQTLVFMRYAREDGGASRLKFGRVNLSGTAELLSTKGRLNNRNLTAAFENFLSDTLILGTGWTLTPVIRLEGSRGRATLPDPGGLLTDEDQNFTVDELVGRLITNTSDGGSSAVISANTATTIAGNLAGGDSNDWGVGDYYNVDPPVIEFWPCIKAIAQPVFGTLRKRSTRLCGTG